MDSKETAQRLFEIFADSDLLRAGGHYGGCDNRAHLIARALQNDYAAMIDEAPRKLWAWSSLLPPSQTKFSLGEHEEGWVDTVIVPSRPAQKHFYDTYNFHVAPLIRIDGASYILDITMFDRPVSPSQWKACFKPPQGAHLHFAQSAAGAYKITSVWQGDTERPSGGLCDRFNAARAYTHLYLMKRHGVGRDCKPMVQSPAP
jgi:hypothetical protein